jgi:surfactin synthase thioesterase subunit
MLVAILFGKDDHILDWREHGAVLKGKVPGLELTLLPGGHMLPITEPDLTAEWIRMVARRTRQPHEQGTEA